MHHHQLGSLYPAMGGATGAFQGADECDAWELPFHGAELYDACEMGTRAIAAGSGCGSPERVRENEKP